MAITFLTTSKEIGDTSVGYGIKSIMNKIGILEDELIQDFKAFFNSIRYSDTPKSKMIKVDQIKEHSDLKEIPNRPGFYVIFSDYPMKHNACTCELIINGKCYKALYRGHSYGVQKRIGSHCFKSRYKGDYTVCLNLNGKSGINIDVDRRYCFHSWYVAYHRMSYNNRSNIFIRETAEKAFDECFSKPVGCKDKVKRMDKSN
ncbi:hypothetical protein [Aneurinibacillus migulanus]|uniref:hypothetical protein n=1 Tax=Aneurinibacillus migulanus TaxID=47500 RepID=UPI00126A2CB7|nr:hypothetical protein [Aneurinibacillus migulanus]